MARRTSSLPSADLLRRVFAVDVLECPACGERMRVLAAIHVPDAVRGILDSLGLPPLAPPVPVPWKTSSRETAPSHIAAIRCRRCTDHVVSHAEPAKWKWDLENLRKLQKLVGGLYEGGVAEILDDEES